jgi:S-adenosyl methyltransferase
VEDSPVAQAPVPQVDTSRPHSARMYDYYLGGKNHFAADRELADTVLASTPMARTSARENRGFLGRAVRFLAAEAGIRQFLDIGLPIRRHPGPAPGLRRVRPDGVHRPPARATGSNAGIGMAPPSAPARGRPPRRSASTAAWPARTDPGRGVWRSAGIRALCAPSGNVPAERLQRVIDLLLTVMLASVALRPEYSACSVVKVQDSRSLPELRGCCKCAHQ